MAEGPITITLPPDPSPELLERLHIAFPDMVVAGPDAAAKAEPTIAAAEAALKTAFAEAGKFPALAADWWALNTAGGWIALVIVASLVIAYAVERIVGALLVREAAPAVASAEFRARAQAAGRAFLRRLLLLAVFAGVAFVLGWLLLPENPVMRILVRNILGAILFARLIFFILDALAAPRAASRRLMGFTDQEAAVVGRATTWLVAILLVLRIPRLFVVAVTAGEPSGHAALLALVAAESVVMIVFFLWTGRPLAALVRRTVDRRSIPTPKWVTFIGTRIGPVYALVVLFDATIKSTATLGLLGPGAAKGSGYSLTILVLAPLLVAGLRLWNSERADRPRNWATSAGFALAEGACIVGAAILLLKAWRIDPFAQDQTSGLGRLLPGLVEAVIVIVVGIALWRAVSTALTPASEDPDAASGPVDEDQVNTGNRMQTVLPILRGFALTIVGITAVLTALTALGVNIGPLLASAGVLGLAVGFGAQRLVSDVISGMFYLMEDAFRMGEYIETDKGKGMVERISLRSVRLRHHRGPVFTIPFSIMGTVQNHSRDWVKIKFMFTVPSDTDLEMVRKLVKKVGASLLDDPEVGDDFLEPLKSQGAVNISGSAYDIGCKFSCPPGKQFLIRRKAYAALQKAFAEKGVKLFAPQLTLQSTPTGQKIGPADAGKPA